MAVYLSRGALRLPAGSLTANSRLCVNLAFEIWLLLGVNVATTNLQTHLCCYYSMYTNVWT